MDKKTRSILKIIACVGIFVLCFYRNRIFPTENRGVQIAGTLIAAVLLGVALHQIFQAFADLFINKDTKAKDTVKKGDTPVKVMTTQELFSFLENEDIIDIVIDNNGELLRVGTASAVEVRPGSRFIDKCYYIEDEEYTDFGTFQAQLLTILNDDEIKILSAKLDGTDVLIK